MANTPAAVDASSSGSPESGSRPPIRWWPAVVILLSGASAIAGISLFESLDPAPVNLARQLLAILTGLALVVWLICFARLSSSARRRVVIAVLAVAVVLAVSIRRIGVTGDLWLDLQWRWTRGAPLPAATRDRAAPRIDLTQTAPSDYPRFLGADCRASVHDVRLARDWSSQPPELIWRREMGQGWSSFAVVGRHAITQEQRDDRELVICYALDTGQIEWMHVDPVAYASTYGGDGPRATPSIDQGRVYTLGATGLLNCLDGATGNKIWSVDVLADNQAQNNEYGMSSSPLVLDSLVVVSAGWVGGKSLAAYDKATGRRVWAAGHDKTGYSSPELATLAGTPQILVLNHNSVAAHDPTTGALLWEYPWPGDEAKVSQPVPLEGDRVFVSSGYGVGCVLLQIARDENGGFAAREVWPRKKYLKTKFTNVVMRDECVYGLDDGILACVDLKTGQQRWKKGRYGHGQILLVDDVLLIQAEDGEVALVEISPQAPRELGRIAALDDKTWNNPVLIGPLLLVRNSSQAACYRLPLAAAAP